MNNRILSILISMLMISTFGSLIVIGDKENEIEKNTNSLNNGFILDQIQTTASHYAAINNDFWLAQSFQPSMSPLVKVRILVRSDGEITDPLEISIRRYFNQEDLTYISIPATSIPTEETWLDCDFPDISVEVEETYYIIVRTASNIHEYHWMLLVNHDMDVYERGSGWASVDGGDNWENLDTLEPYEDFCFKTYSYSGINPDLECNGVLGWPDQKPNSTVNGTFTIQNIGDPKSLLNWKIDNYPDWGTWTFTQTEGLDLTPEDGILEIKVTVNVPNEQDKDYKGEIKIVNTDNTSDSCSIQVSLSTPKTKKQVLDLHYILDRILDRFTTLQRLLNKIL